MNQQMIGKSWLEWENDLPDDSDSAEEEFLEYRQTVKKETPQLTIDHDIKSEVRYDHIHFSQICPLCGSGSAWRTVRHKGHSQASAGRRRPRPI